MPEITPPKTKNNRYQSPRRETISSRLGMWMRTRRRCTISFGVATSFKVPARCSSRNWISSSGVAVFFRFVILTYSAGYSTNPTVPGPKLMASEMERSVNSALFTLKLFLASSSKALPDSISRACTIPRCTGASPTNS
jgi:hypothetical protein